jgi:hypothetical protein
MFPFTRTVLVFLIAGLLFFAPLSASILGSLMHPAETGLLIPSNKSECIEGSRRRGRRGTYGME